MKHGYQYLVVLSLLLYVWDDVDTWEGRQKGKEGMGGSKKERTRTR